MHTAFATMGLVSVIMDGMADFVPSHIAPQPTATWLVLDMASVMRSLACVIKNGKAMIVTTSHAQMRSLKMSIVLMVNLLASQAGLV